jgi:hypothetical protein
MNFDFLYGLKILYFSVLGEWKIFEVVYDMQIIMF